MMDRRLGEFQLTELIGEGGFGQVFRAHQASLQRDAVIKVLRIERRGNEAAVDRFLAEARLASRLDHPFAAHVYAFGAEPDGLLWIAMELVRGTPLERVLEHGPLPVERAVPFLRRLCEVVQTAHDQGIVHRDLKPANVMVISRAGSVFPKLLDLGIALDQHARSLDANRGPLGTPYYMAPEQWVDPAKAGPAADIYALGAITYETLVGRPPFEGDSVIAVAVKHARAAPPKLPAGFPAGLDDAIARAMAKRPHARFATALELGAALVDASGLGADTVPMPQLDDALRTDVMLRMPRPIAETVAVLDAARNPHQARLALRQVERALAQLVGIVALACRTRSGPGRRSDPTAALDLLRELRKRRLDAAEWWQLARELCRSFAAIPDAHPMPELVALFFDGISVRVTALDGDPPPDPPAGAAPDEVRRALAAGLPRVDAALRELGFLAGYPLVVPDGRAELWMGVRRPQQAELDVDHPLDHRRPVLMGADGRPVVSLWPLVQAAEPTPNAALELFVLAGAARGAASLVATPHGFERTDDTLWEWLGGHVGALADDDGAAAADDASPYLGLATFQEDDADAFLGRERDVDALVNRLRTTPLVAVVGPSGVGKSSFVRAGVLPALARHAPTRRLAFRPGHAPIAGLARQLAAVGIALDAETIATDPDVVGDELRAAAADTAIAVVVDQFEELFTLCRDAGERAIYARALAGAARTAEDPVRVIVTVRDDFLVRTSTLPVLRERLAASLHILTTPTPEDLRRILVEPAHRVGYEFEDAALLDEIVADVADRPGALALLSFTAFQLWQVRDRHFHRLPRKAYTALGGVGGALGRHAEQTMTAMSAEQQRLVRVAFRHLITADGTRAVVDRRDLETTLAGAASAAGVATSVVEALIEARLIVASEGDRGEHRIEVAHEALLSAWPRLVTWRHEDAEGVRFRDHLRAAAKQWDERGRPAGLLWRGDALVEYQLWRPRFADALGAVEDAFARASTTEASRSRRIRRTLVTGAIVSLAIVSLVLWRLSERAAASAAEARGRVVAALIEQGRQAALRGDLAESLVYLAEARERGDGTALRFLLRRAARAAAYEHAIRPGSLLMETVIGTAPPVQLRAGGSQVVGALADGLYAWDLATGEVVARLDLAMPNKPMVRSGGDRVVAVLPSGPVLWDPRDGAHRRLSDDGDLFLVQFSRDGARVAAFGNHGVHVWDAASGRAIAALGDGKPAIEGVMSDDGERVAMMSDHDRIRVFDVASGTEVATIAVPHETIAIGGFDPSHRRVLTLQYTGDCAAILWDATGGGAPPIVMRGHQQAIIASAIDRAGTRIATGSRDRSVKVWDATTGSLVLDLTSHRGIIQTLEFSADGKRLLSTSTDRTARVWDTATGAEVALIAQPDLRQATLAPDGSRVITASTNEIKVWSATSTDLLLELPGHAAVVVAAAYSRDGRWIATEDRRQIVRLWERASGTLVRTLDGDDLGSDKYSMFGGLLTYQRKLLAFDHRGERLAAPAGDAVALWSVATGERAGTLTGHAALVSSVRFGPDAAPDRAITAGQDGVAIVWDATTLAPVRRLEAGSTLWYAEIAPDGEHALTVGDAGAQVWRWRDAVVVHHLAAGEVLQSGAYSPDGRRVVAAGASGRVWLWSAADGAIAATFDSGSRTVRAVRFVGNELLATTTADGITRIWDAARQVELYHYGQGGLGGDGGGIERWVEVSPDNGSLAVVGRDRVGRIWSLDLDARPPAEIAAWVRCRIPLDLVDQRIVPRARTAADCGGTP